MSVVKVVELVGTSDVSWEDAVKQVVWPRVQGGTSRGILRMNSCE